MTNAVTQTTLRYVGEPTGEFLEGTSNRLYQSLDGATYVTTSFAPGDEDYPAHVMAWTSEDEGGYPDPVFMIRLAVQGEEPFYVNGDDTDATHAEALSRLGFAVEQEDAA